MVRCYRESRTTPISESRMFASRRNSPIPSVNVALISCSVSSIEANAPAVSSIFSDNNSASAELTRSFCCVAVRRFVVAFII